MPDSHQRLSVAEVYDRLHRAQRQSATLKRVWLLASGEDYPEPFDHLSFITLADLHQIVAELQLRPGHTLVDLACGTGGPGLWLAREAAVGLTGIDVSATALAEARDRAVTLKLHDRVDYRQASFEETRLPSASVDGAFSADALVYAGDLSAATREIARILRPGGRFVGTTFEVDVKIAASLGMAVNNDLADYRPVFKASGFQIITYEETPGWAERVRRTYDALISERERLIADTDPTALKVLVAELARGAEDKLMKRRVLITAERQ